MESLIAELTELVTKAQAALESATNQTAADPDLDTLVAAVEAYVTAKGWTAPAPVTQIPVTDAEEASETPADEAAEDATPAE